MRLVVVEVDELQRLIREAVEACHVSAQRGDDWVDARTSPLGRRMFLKLARQGAFPVSMMGNKYVARRRDIEAYLDAQRVRGTTQQPTVSGQPPVTQSRVQDESADDPIARALASGRLRVVPKLP